MSDLFVPQVGAVFSADIAVPEHEREVRFYSRVLGTGDNPLWREDLMNNLGMPIIGLGALIPEYASPHPKASRTTSARLASSTPRGILGGFPRTLHRTRPHARTPCWG
jgi:uncharacterized protein